MSDEEDIVSRAAERLGTVLHGKYRLDAVLGVGGMAVVYAATHRNQKRFAIKLLHTELSIRSGFRARFLREGYAANSVAHEGVVAVLDDDVDETGAAFLVMELLAGVDVQALRERAGGKLPLRVALCVAHQLLGVLAAAHEKAIVHRDIKPANLFLVETGQLKVLDFGIARLHDAASQGQTTRTGALLGTPAFMAPEQAAAQGDEIEARSDLWAVGACLFTLISGQFVHEAENARQTLIRAATLPARSLAEVVPDVPASVVALVTRALMFDKAARWESASAMREAVAMAHRELFGEPSEQAIQDYLASFALSSAARAPRVSSLLSVPASALSRVARAARTGGRSALMLGLAGALLGAALLARALLPAAAHKMALGEQSAPLSTNVPSLPAVHPSLVSASGVAPSSAAGMALEAKPPSAAAPLVRPQARLAKSGKSANRASKLPAANGESASTSASSLTALAPANPLQLELQ